jgi:hypothetical protein
MAQPRRIRLTVAAGGALAMVGGFLAACAASWLFLSAMPNSFGGGRLWMFLPIAPLTAVAITIAGTQWSRRVRPSAMESIGALAIVELIILAVIATSGGALFLASFVVLAVVSVAFAPWWLLGVRLGRPRDERR